MTSIPRADAATRAIVIEEVLPHAPEVIWKVLTEPELLSRWLMQNDFAARVGHRFTFKARPMGDWDGVVRCEVLEIEPHRRLVYSWVGGSANNAVHGSVLDSVLSIDLTPVPGGTRLRLVHDGFRSPQNDAGYDAMSKGWGGIVQRIDAIARDVTGER
jgi:uncharacterized protein YndB with AHSA1/START domain